MITYRIKDLRRLGAAMRDRRFDLRSPIPSLAPEQLSAMGADWVQMPPSVTSMRETRAPWVSSG